MYLHQKPWLVHYLYPKKYALEKNLAASSISPPCTDWCCDSGAIHGGHRQSSLSAKIGKRQLGIRHLRRVKSAQRANWTSTTKPGRLVCSIQIFFPQSAFRQSEPRCTKSLIHRLWPSRHLAALGGFIFHYKKSGRGEHANWTCIENWSWRRGR